MLTRDLVQKRDVLRRQLGTELGDRTFREWLEASVAAAVDPPAPAESPVPEPDGDPVAPKEAAVPVPREEPVAPAESPVAPGRGCKWIEAEHGDPGWPDQTCGRERAPGRPYCREHCRKAYLRNNGTPFPLKHFDRPPRPRKVLGLSA